MLVNRNTKEAYRIMFTYVVDVPKNEVEDQDEAMSRAFSEFCQDHQCADIHCDEVLIEEED